MRLICSLGATAREMVFLFGACARERTIYVRNRMSALSTCLHSFPCLYFIFPGDLPRAD